MGRKVPRSSKNPNLQPLPYDPESEYEKGVTVTFPDEQLGENAVREYRSTKKIQKGEAPNLSDGSWKQAHSDDYELESNSFPRFNAYSAMR